jgi:hypothetical protein
MGKFALRLDSPWSLRSPFSQLFSQLFSPRSFGLERRTTTSCWDSRRQLATATLAVEYSRPATIPGSRGQSIDIALPQTFTLQQSTRLIGSLLSRLQQPSAFLIVQGVAVHRRFISGPTFRDKDSQREVKRDKDSARRDPNSKQQRVTFDFRLSTFGLQITVSCIQSSRVPLPTLVSVGQGILKCSDESRPDESILIVWPRSGDTESHLAPQNRRTQFCQSQRPKAYIEPYIEPYIDSTAVSRLFVEKQRLRKVERLRLCPNGSGERPAHFKLPSTAFARFS